VDKQPQYRITGPWIAADSSPNHIELAETAEPGVRAMRSTFWPENVLFTTAGQLRAALEALETKREFRELVSR
jgi:hypothetical protein